MSASYDASVIFLINFFLFLTRLRCTQDIVGSRPLTHLLFLLFSFSYFFFFFKFFLLNFFFFISIFFAFIYSSSPMQASWRTRLVASPAPRCALPKSLRRSQYTWRGLLDAMQDPCTASNLKNIIRSHPGIRRNLNPCMRAYEILRRHILA
jgi:hypothetical protein